MSQYMVIETFMPGCKDKVYERYHSRGRMLPNGLAYIDSWLEKNGDRCFQLMTSIDSSLFQQWIKHWEDLVRFEIIELAEAPQKTP